MVAISGSPHESRRPIDSARDIEQGPEMGKMWKERPERLCRPTRPVEDAARLALARDFMPPGQKK